MNKKSVNATALSCLIGWQISTAVNGATNGTVVCVNENSRISQKSSCALDETELASNSVKRKQIRRRLMTSDSIVLRGGTRARTASTSNQTLIGAVGQSMRSYTYALTFERGWDGNIKTSCGSFEVPINTVAVAYLEGKPLPEESGAKLGELFFSGTFLSYVSNGPPYHFLTPHFSGNSVTPQNNYFSDEVDRSNYIIDPDWPDGLVLYVTQVCAPLTDLTQS